MISEEKSQRLGPHNINCEARLARGELEMELTLSLGPRSNHLPGNGESSRGLELVARQAERAFNRSKVVVAGRKHALT